MWHCIVFHTRHFSDRISCGEESLSLEKSSGSLSIIPLRPIKCFYFFHGRLCFISALNPSFSSRRCSKTAHWAVIYLLAGHNSHNYRLFWEQGFALHKLYFENDFQMRLICDREGIPLFLEAASKPLEADSRVPSWVSGRIFIWGLEQGCHRREEKTVPLICFNTYLKLAMER